MKSSVRHRRVLGAIAKKCEKSKQEIDLMAVDETGKGAIFAECKWLGELMPESAIERIQRHVFCVKRIAIAMRLI